MNTAEIKVSDLEGAALDLAVAWADGDKVSVEDGYVVVAEFSEQHGDFFNVCYSPSTNWSQGGPLIEANKIELLFFGSLGECGCPWEAQLAYDIHYIVQRPGEAVGGATPLIAAMRAIVASKLGEVVNVPVELLP